MISTYKGLPINHCKWNIQSIKPTLEHHSNNYFRQDIPPDAKINGQKFKKE